MSAIRVLLADDHKVLREGVRALLTADGGFDVVGEAADGREALRRARELTPQVALLDIAMPELNGLDAAARIVSAVPGCAVIILSMHAGESYVLESLKAGAAGYLLKNCSADELRNAVRAVARGERYLAPEVSKHVIEAALRGQSSPAAGAPAAVALTPRQREILQLVAEGRSTREIAEKLHLSEKTVEMHRAQVKERLDIYDTAGLVRYAIRIGLISAD